MQPRMHCPGVRISLQAAQACDPLKSDGVSQGKQKHRLACSESAGRKTSVTCMSSLTNCCLQDTRVCQGSLATGISAAAAEQTSSTASITRSARAEGL